MSSGGKGKNSQQDKIFKALADGTRRKVLDYLREKPRTTGEICDKIKHLDRCTVMLHLKVLEQADLIMVRREGRVRWNHLNIDPIQGIYRRWIKDYAEPSAHLLSRLKEELET
ncbi:MAG: helix-turn-helix domain-containing protein [Bdellovibrionota bacterium]